MLLQIGFDDTDSPNGGCTTYIAAKLVEKLTAIDVSFVDYPRLIRLNPNVPWKTRGNGALCLQLDCSENSVDNIKNLVINTIEAYSKLDYNGTDPGIVFVQEDVTPEIRDFAKKAEHTLLTIDETLKLSKKVNADTIGFKKGRGIIGGLAAIGEDLTGDYTYEIIAYRTSSNRNRPRCITASSVKMMDKNSPFTFNNVDPETGRVLITPRGPDPILCGIRGETPDVVKQAYKLLTINEPVERWVIFRTNQGTDAHLKMKTAVANIQPYNSVVVQGVVSQEPKVIQGGHVIFSIKDDTGEVDCAAYEPTVLLCKAAKKLIIGDVLTVYGGVRPKSEHQFTINLEKMKVLKLAPKVLFVNPKCPECGKRLKSMGKNQGFRCDKCGFRSSQICKLQIREEREIEVGLYITSPRSQRHLTKPHRRYGREKIGAPKEMIKEWHHP